MKEFKSTLLLGKDDYLTLCDYKYKWFLPLLIAFICLFAAFSPLIKGVGFVPIFIILFISFVVAVVFYNLLNKKIKEQTNSLFKEKELINFNLTFNENGIYVLKNDKEYTLKYKNVIKIEEYESFFIIYTNNEELKTLPVKKDVGDFKDGSDFIKFLFTAVKLKQKKVKKIHLRKQKAFITIIVLLVFVVSTLMPIIYMFAYNLFDYGRFGIR